MQVSGSFSDWKPIPMCHDPVTNSFVSFFSLRLGVYQYKFIVDNVWSYDVEAPTRLDSEGNVNNVLFACTFCLMLQLTPEVNKSPVVIGNTTDTKGNCLCFSIVLNFIRPCVLFLALRPSCRFRRTLGRLGRLVRRLFHGKI